MNPAEAGLVALAVLNVIAFAAFGFDKSRARRGGGRVSERTLLLLAAAGGTPGAYAGRSAFAHKTRKASFFLRLHAVAAAQVMALALLVYWLG
ncbi:DUF1294 domain-containing protein [Novosphingobium resinovorum]|uniref:DUF1294 domain-containing protein n=1 Tax=Novosphingobium resinovorum TaxID=158500 RepID=UPI002ED1829F|nr:DUF1294 domain-containing protein [Novosphingobium resinovorum]